LITITETGQQIAKTAPGQIAVVGTLTSGATTSCSWSENTALAPNASPAAYQSRAVRAERPDLVLRQHTQCRNVSGAGPVLLGLTPMVPTPKIDSVIIVPSSADTTRFAARRT
jgi:hypothetical protein